MTGTQLFVRNRQVVVDVLLHELLHKFHITTLENSKIDKSQARK